LSVRSHFRDRSFSGPVSFECRCCPFLTSDLGLCQLVLKLIDVVELMCGQGYQPAQPLSFSTDRGYL
jgi:hypothetical protein